MVFLIFEIKKNICDDSNSKYKTEANLLIKLLLRFNHLFA